MTDSAKRLEAWCAEVERRNEAIGIDWMMTGGLSVGDGCWEWLGGRDRKGSRPSLDAGRLA